MYYFRLVIPRCNKNERAGDFYCKLSNIDNISNLQNSIRYNLLQDTFNSPFFANGNIFRIHYPNCNCRIDKNPFENTNIQNFTVITSNNFFYLKQLSNQSTKCSIITRQLIPYLNTLSNKKSLILGFDVDGVENPYNGINAIVSYLSINNGNFIPTTCIWESWSVKNNCNVNAFRNQRRIINLNNNNSIGLMSCGDICPYCWNRDTSNLPNANIWIDLSHMSLRGHTCQNRTPLTILRKRNNVNTIIITHQVTEGTLNKYLRDGYPYIFINQNILAFARISPYIRNNNLIAIFVDLILDNLAS